MVSDVFYKSQPQENIMAKWKVTVEFEDSAERKNVDKIVKGALSDKFYNVKVIEAEKVSITPEEAIKQIQELLYEQYEHGGTIAIYQVQEIISKVQNNANPF